ncbi:hypothetical protein PIB30_047886 [Stylosanthes scabra]|uniref:Uncharacterized protein n=1 Tax=Stylosanthes scabra TaxID=79078 RepID=A0ABU6YH35_9FABA|nr:hypothetical protein [Stylosanthes scabra]
MEETQECSHDYMQQEEGQTAVKTDRNKKDSVQRDQFREGKGRREGDKNLYYKYYKQNGHDTEECNDLLGFVEQGLKNGKFYEYTNKYRQRDDDRRVSEQPGKQDRKKTDPKERSMH